jgi:FHA domain-containing protein
VSLERGDDLQKVRKEMAKADFEKKYAHLWLIRELDPDERAPSSFNTVSWDSKKTIALGKKLKTAGGGMQTRLRIDPGRYGLYPLMKSGANPWTDRVLVGRASNNDIVFRHESVSKVHAYFEKGEGSTLRLHDAKSANGTRVDGKAVEPGGAGAEVKSGTTLLFGSLACEVINTSDLFDSL